MRRLVLLLLGFAACSEQEEAKAPGPPTATIEAAPAPPGRETVSVPSPAPTAPAASPAPAGTLTPAPDRTAVRLYEHLLNGVRAATMSVEWKPVEREGRKLVEDVTETVSREERDMAGFVEAFDSQAISRTLRTEEGELISQETVTTMPGRVDKTRIERTGTGYRVRILAGGSEEVFEVAAEEPVMVDAEAFLSKRIQAGEAKPGAVFRFAQFAGKRIVTGTLRVIGPDAEGPGLKVVETTEGEDALWWFADDGSVVRLRSGIRVIQRNDSVRPGDLPSRPARFKITLATNLDLPRIFTTRQMLVDIVVRTDETTKPPQIPESPFTEVKERTPDRVTVLLKSHDDPAATCPLPIDPKGFGEYLKATALMEVDDPEVRDLAKEIVGDAKDAREGARRIADYVFSSLEKGSSKLLQPTAKQILEDMRGDCSEHALLFTALCRAAGIPVRQCSGYVCIGEDWGSHSWCEVWVGRWIGADPTTNEIGTRARYILLARPDEPVDAGRITPERTSIVVRRAEYDDGSVDGSATDDLTVFSGIRLGPVPEGWTVTRERAGVRIDGPDFRAAAQLHADQGYRTMKLLTMQLPGGKEGAFGGRPAVVGMGGQRYWVSLGREILDVQIRMHRRSAEPPMEALAKLLAPTLERAE